MNISKFAKTWRWEFLTAGALFGLGGIWWISSGLVGIDRDYTDTAAALISSIAATLVSIGFHPSRSTILEEESNRLIRDKAQESRVLRRRVDIPSSITLVDKYVFGAARRLNEYCRENTQTQLFLENHNLLHVILDDLDQAAAEAAALSALLADQKIDSVALFVGAELVDSLKGELVVAERSIEEALNRRNEFALWLNGQDKYGDDVWSAFQTATSDLANAFFLIKNLKRLTVSSSREGAMEQLRRVRLYLEKSLGHLVSSFQRMRVLLPEEADPSQTIRQSDRPLTTCLLYTSPSPRDQRGSRMPSSA